MRGGGRGRRRGGGGGGGRGSGGRDARGASRDDRDRRGDGRPEYRPRRSPSLDRRARRLRSPDDDVRAVPRSGRMEYGGGYHDRDRDRDRPRGARAGYGGGRDPSPGCGRFDYDDPRDVPGRGRRDCGGDRDGSRRYPSPRDYGRAPYRQDRYDRIGRGGDRDPIGSYEALPAYMLPDHPTDQGRSYLRAGKKQDDYLGGSSDRSFNRDSKYFGGPRHRSIDKESEFFGDGGTLKISVTESGRTSSLYQDRGSPQRVALPPPPPLYPSVPPTETGFLTGGSSMEPGDGFGSGKSRLLHDGGGFKNREHFIDPYVRETKRRGFLGSRDVLLEKDGGTDRLYPVVDMPLRRERETDRLYSSRDILGSDLGTQVKHIGDSSSSLLVEGQPYRMHTEPGYEPGNGYNMDGFGRLSHDSLGHGSGHAHRFSGGSLEHGSDHGDEALLDIARHAHSKHEPRSESLEYDAHEYARTGLYVALENLPGNVSQNSRHISGSASLRGLKDERINHHCRLSHRMEEDEDSFQAIHHDMEHNMRPSYEGEASVHYQPARSGNDHYSHSPGTEPIGFARRSVHHELASFEDGHDLSDQEVSPMVSRKRYRSPAYHDRDMDMHQADEFTGHGYYSDDMDAYDLSSPRMSRIYDIDQMVDDEDGYDAGYDMRTSRDVFSRLALPHEINDEWADVDHENHPHLVHGRPNHKPMSQRLSIPNAHSQFGGPYVHGRGRGRGRGRGLTKSAKKRMRMSLHQFNDGYTPERNDITRPNKFSKSSEDDPNGSEVNHEDAPEDEDLTMQKDPPEGSEEFSRQVHQAFLKYSKILNESQAMQKRFLDAPKGSLSCCVCGSVARKFPDVDALLSHAYDTCKVGLKTKHLGFHKALCLLMGWNWHVAPDTAKVHHYIQAEEVNAMKGDLILWPPVVVIHNSSIANKTKDTEAKVISIEEIKGVVADIGVACGKVKVSHGRPANQSVFLVKFQPTISGFQEAMRVHGHFATRNHGKEEFQQMKSGKGKQAVPIHNLEELLYAHIGVAEDLGYLDEETKKRCVIRSRKDTQDTADATLNLEP